MPREKAPDSSRTFGGLGFDPGSAEEKEIKKFLKNKGISLNAFTRSLYRGWLKTRKIGVSDITNDL